MEYRRLGVSGVRVSEIGLGSWLTYGVGVEAERAKEIVARAYDLGVNFFDTANAYGRGAAERVLGEALAGYPRDSYVLATKVFYPMGDGPNDGGLSRKHVLEQCDASLRRLATDYIDLYQCHRYDDETPLDETLPALDDLVRRGKVLYVGVSEWTADQIAAALHIADELGLDRVVAAEAGLSIAQLALAWVLREPNVASAIVGATRPEQIEENCAAAGRTLDDDVLTAVDKAVGEVLDR